MGIIGSLKDFDNLQNIKIMKPDGYYDGDIINIPGRLLGISIGDGNGGYANGITLFTKSNTYITGLDDYDSGFKVRTKTIDTQNGTTFFVQYYQYPTISNVYISNQESSITIKKHGSGWGRDYGNGLLIAYI
nr:MAG TPA: hypothetical protein [Caudoviricetes sp.]